MTTKRKKQLGDDTFKKPEHDQPKSPQEWAFIIIRKLFLRNYDWDDKSTPLLRYHRGKYYEYEDGRYRDMSLGDMEYRVASFLRHPASCLSPTDIEAPFLDPAEKVTNRFTSDVIFNIRSFPEIFVPDHIDPPCWLGSKEQIPTQGRMISMENGLLSLDNLLADKEEVIFSWTPRWFNLIRIPYEYQPAATCPKWETFISEIMGGNKELEFLLQQWTGYLLTPDTSLHKFLLCVGPGANGKGVLFRVIEALLGEENISHTPLEVFGDKFALWTTIDKLANIVSEIGNLDRVAEGRLKEFVGADRLDIDRKFLKPVSVKPTARLMLATNNLPYLADRSRGVWRRLLLVPFNRIFTTDEQIPDLADDLIAELSGIFNWGITGLRSLRATGKFIEPTASQEALDEYRIDCDPAREFLQEHYEADPLGAVQSGEIYQRYRRWCTEENHRPVSNRTFGKDIKRVFFGVKRARFGPKNERIYQYEGIKQI
ncbi:phage/plasmid primase, P4 family [Planctomycetota bacterium]